MSYYQHVTLAIWSIGQVSCEIHILNLSTSSFSKTFILILYSHVVQLATWQLDTINIHNSDVFGITNLWNLPFSRLLTMLWTSHSPLIDLVVFENHRIWYHLGTLCNRWVDNSIASQHETVMYFTLPTCVLCHLVKYYLGCETHIHHLST